jgi:hypothetical protein
MDMVIKYIGMNKIINRGSRFEMNNGLINVMNKI